MNIEDVDPSVCSSRIIFNYLTHSRLSWSNTVQKIPMISVVNGTNSMRTVNTFECIHNGWYFQSEFDEGILLHSLMCLSSEHADRGMRAGLASSLSRGSRHQLAPLEASAGTQNSRLSTLRHRPDSYFPILNFYVLGRKLLTTQPTKTVSLETNFGVSTLKAHSPKNICLGILRLHKFI